MRSVVAAVAVSAAVAGACTSDAQPSAVSSLPGESAVFAAVPDATVAMAIEPGEFALAGVVDLTNDSESVVTVVDAGPLGADDGVTVGSFRLVELFPGRPLTARDETIEALTPSDRPAPMTLTDRPVLEPSETKLLTFEVRRSPRATEGAVVGVWVEADVGTERIRQEFPFLFVVCEPKSGEVGCGTYRDRDLAELTGYDELTRRRG